jgi:hypothetical protein
MELLYFLIARKTRSYVSLQGNWKGLLGDVLLIFLFLFYGAMITVLYNFSLTHETRHFKAGLLLTSLKFSVLSIPIVFKIFPSFTLKRTFIGVQYPVGKLKVAFLDLMAFTLWRTRVFAYLLFVTIFCIFAGGTGSDTMLSLFLLLAAGILVAENIVHSISWHRYIYLAATVIPLVVLYLMISIGRSLPVITAAIIILNILLYFSCYERNYTPASSGGITGSIQEYKGPTHFYLYRKLLLGNSTFRTVLLTGLFFKLLILSTVVFLRNGSMEAIAQKVPFLLCLVMPILLFTYIYNNAWGYFHAVTLNNLITGVPAKRQLKIYLSLLLPALLIDFALTCICLGISGALDVKILLTYLVMVVFSVPVGIVSSFGRYMPVPVALSFNQFRGKTSKLYTFVLLIPAMATSLVYTATMQLYIALGLILATSIGFCLYIKQHIGTQVTQLKKDFFSSK